MRRRVVIWTGLAVAAFAFSDPAGAASAQGKLLRAGGSGQIVDLPGDRGLAELFSVDEKVAPALLALAPEEGREIDAFPTAPGVRRRVHLVRHEIYAEGARIYRVEGQFRTEVPRSKFVFFWGSDLEGAGNRLFVALDPATRAFSGLVHGPEGTHEIARELADPRERHILARPRVPEGAAWRCAQEDFVETAVSWAPSPTRSAEALPPRRSNALSSLHSGILAVDTDNEYMAYWSNNTANATNYIATLLASINVMYERDLNLRLLQGTTFLRTTADPYVQGPGSGQSANGAELTEFRTVWNSTYPMATYPRAMATLLSGKQPDAFSASGIASLAGTVCGSFDYSFCQLFKVSYLMGDTLIVGHEIGHNLGSPHTHCYANPKPDTCYAGEGGTNCFSGTGSCPAPLMINGYAATGTIMSYCHIGPCNSGTTYAFHPETISRYVGDTLDAGASVGCLAVVGGGGGGSPPPPVSAATTLHPLTPCRLIDTRNAAGPLGGPAIGGAGQRTFIVPGNCGVPSGAVAVSANVTIVNPAAQGGLLVYPGGMSAPTASSISFRAGRTRANSVQIYLALDGAIVARNNSGGALDFVVDVNGYYQ